VSELGQALKEAREEKGLSLDDLQERTKIQKRYLKAIEDGDFNQLPGDFYIRAFIKSYAETVGLDFSALIQQYASEIPSLHHDQPEIHTLPPSGTKPAPATRSGSGDGGGSVRLSSFLNRALVIVIILIVLMLAYLLITGIMSNQGNAGASGSQNSGSSVSFSGSSSSSGSTSSSSSGSSAAGTSSTSVQQVLKKDTTQGTTTTYTLTGTQKFDVAVSSKNGQQAWFGARDAKTGKLIQQGVVSGAGTKSVHINAANVQSLELQFGAVPNTQLKINGQNFSFPGKGTVQTIIINYSK
jgi:Uncharacterized protein conserved in bacteria